MPPEELNRLAMEAGLNALRAIHAAAAAHPSAVDLAAIDRHVAADHMLTAVVNMSGSKTDVSLALIGPTPLETRIVFKLDCMLGGELPPAWSIPPGKPN